MKRILTILCTMITAIGSASVQNPMAEDMSRWADGWKHAFSKEEVREWKPEFTLRYYDGLVTAGPMLTGGIRIDEKRSFSIFMSQGNRYADYAPGDIYSIGTGICFRRYWHLGKRKTFAIYSDLYAGAGWIYKISGKYHLNTQKGGRREVIKENVGDMIFIGGWQPGIRVRCYKNLHLFIGPTLAAECLGAHLGIGF